MRIVPAIQNSWLALLIMLSPISTYARTNAETTHDFQGKIFSVDQLRTQLLTWIDISDETESRLALEQLLLQLSQSSAFEKSDQNKKTRSDAIVMLADLLIHIPPAQQARLFRALAIYNSSELFEPVEIDPDVASKILPILTAIYDSRRSQVNPSFLFKTAELFSYRNLEMVQWVTQRRSRHYAAWVSFSPEHFSPEQIQNLKNQIKNPNLPTLAKMNAIGVLALISDFSDDESLIPTIRTLLNVLPFRKQVALIQSVIGTPLEKEMFSWLKAYPLGQKVFAPIFANFFSQSAGTISTDLSRVYEEPEIMNELDAFFKDSSNPLILRVGAMTGAARLYGKSEKFYQIGDLLDEIRSTEGVQDFFNELSKLETTGYPIEGIYIRLIEHGIFEKDIPLPFKVTAAKKTFYVTIFKPEYFDLFWKPIEDSNLEPGDSLSEQMSRSLSNNWLPILDEKVRDSWNRQNIPPHLKRRLYRILGGMIASHKNSSFWAHDQLTLAVKQETDPTLLYWAIKGLLIDPSRTDIEVVIKTFSALKEDTFFIEIFSLLKKSLALQYSDNFSKYKESIDQKEWTTRWLSPLRHINELTSTRQKEALTWALETLPLLEHRPPALKDELDSILAGGINDPDLKLCAISALALLGSSKSEKLFASAIETAPLRESNHVTPILRFAAKSQMQSLVPAIAGFLNRSFPSDQEENMGTHLNTLMENMTESVSALTAIGGEKAHRAVMQLMIRQWDAVTIKDSQEYYYQALVNGFFTYPAVIREDFVKEVLLPQTHTLEKKQTLLKSHPWILDAEGMRAFPFFHGDIPALFKDSQAIILQGGSAEKKWQSSLVVVKKILASQNPDLTAQARLTLAQAAALLVLEERNTDIHKLISDSDEPLSISAEHLAELRESEPVLRDLIDRILNKLLNPALEISSQNLEPLLNSPDAKKLLQKILNAVQDFRDLRFHLQTALLGVETTHAQENARVQELVALDLLHTPQKDSDRAELLRNGHLDLKAAKAFFRIMRPGIKALSAEHLVALFDIALKVWRSLAPVEQWVMYMNSPDRSEALKLAESLAQTLAGFESVALDDQQGSLKLKRRGLLDRSNSQNGEFQKSLTDLQAISIESFKKAKQLIDSKRDPLEIDLWVMRLILRGRLTLALNVSK